MEEDFQRMLVCDVCGEPSAFGFGVTLEGIRMGDVGSWRCAEHHPDQDRQIQRTREEWAILNGTEIINTLIKELTARPENRDEDAMSNHLDRMPDGVVRKCCECSRPFMGEGWQDYCAECHAEKEANSPLKKLWACTTCNSTFPVGEVRIHGSAGDPWPCPRCGSRTITPADGAARETDVYYGGIGTRQ